MRTICYYVSDYGYGHATRSIAIIRRLIESAAGKLRLIVCSSKALSFIQQSLIDHAEFVEYRQCSSDLGYILQSGSIQPDLSRLGEAYLSYIEKLPSQVEREKHFLLQEKVDLVISDISPVPFAAANLANITSLGISNFTWFTAYTRMLDEKMLEPLYRAYSNMDYFVSLAGGITEPQWGRRGYFQTGFFCRTPYDEEVNRLKAQFNPEHAKIIVFFALGMSIHVDDLKQMAMWNDDSCLFIVSNNMHIDGDNIIRIPEHVTESQDYLAVCDIVITKPGWGTVSEAVTLGKPLLLLERSSFLEDHNTIEALTGLHPYRLLEWEQLKNLRVTGELIKSIKDDESNPLPKKESEPLQEIVEFIHHLVHCVSKEKMYFL